MSKEREYKIKKLEKSIEKKRAAYNKLSRGGIAKRTETKIKALTNKELYVKFERKKVLVNGRKGSTAQQGVQKEAYASQRIPHLKLFAGRTLSS